MAMRLLNVLAADGARHLAIMDDAGAAKRVGRFESVLELTQDALRSGWSLVDSIAKAGFSGDVDVLLAAAEGRLLPALPGAALHAAEAGAPGAVAGLYIIDPVGAPFSIGFVLCGDIEGRGALGLEVVISEAPARFGLGDGFAAHERAALQAIAARPGEAFALTFGGGEAPKPATPFLLALRG